MVIESISSYQTSLSPISGDFHVSGLIIIPLLSKNNSKFKARSLLDSGSGTNFVSKEICLFITNYSMNLNSIYIFPSS